MAIDLSPQHKTLVVGLGKTGLSCARFLRARGEAVAITDSRDLPPGLDELRAEMSDVALMLGGFPEPAFAAADRLVVSPGVSLEEPAIKAALVRGVPLTGDIGLFVDAAEAPIAAITGSNGKSTVTTLVGLMTRLAGVRAGIGGNLGEPALDLIDPAMQLYVLELSSFQLERTERLGAKVAAVLNLSPDHMDRYADFDAYVEAKARIFDGATIAVLNRDDARVMAMAPRVGLTLSFGLDEPGGEHDFGVRDIDGEIWLVHGSEPLLRTAELSLPGRHNRANALAAVAIGSACGLPLEAMLEALRGFRGLPHRTELVAEIDGVRWFNDSKGTNPGATVAALAGLVEDPTQGKAVLIAGGDCKGADFASMQSELQRSVRAVVLIGRDADQIDAQLPSDLERLKARSMDDAVTKAARLSSPGDLVLLSPACASFDMFRNYEHRGELFSAAVWGLRT